MSPPFGADSQGITGIGHPQKALRPRGSRQTYPMSTTESARKPLESAKLLGVRQTIAPLAIRDLPTTLRTNSKLTLSATVGTSFHLASNSSSLLATSTTKST